MSRGLLSLILFFLCSCGLVDLGASSNPNDATPSGTAIAFGSFTGLNGKTVSGGVTVYDQQGGAYVVRLEGVVFPSDTTLQMIPTVDGSALGSYLVRASSGTMNISVTASVGAQWNKITIHSASKNMDYAQAMLTMKSGV